MSEEAMANKGVADPSSQSRPESEEEEPEIYIQHGELKESFPLSEANNPQKVKSKFKLNYTPAFVLAGKKEKQVNFGNLKPGVKYKLEDTSLIPDLKIHTQNAAILSNAVYQDDPIPYLTESSPNHTIKTVCAVSKNSEQGVMIAVGEVGGNNTLYVAFRGTVSWNDVVADADISLRENPSILGGRIHSGFAKRAESVPLKQIKYCLRKEDCENIITCGHSLGGAVSAISAINLMIDLGSESDTKVFNITFGSPMFANESVRKKCQNEGYSQHMIHYVGHQDIVPGILSLGHTISELKKITQMNLNNVTGGIWEVLNQQCGKFLEVAAKVASFVLQNNPWNSKDDITTDVKVLWDLAGTILSDIKATSLGEQYLPDQFVPVGNFFVVEREIMSPLLASTITAPIQETILKEPLRQIKTLMDVTKGHSLFDYYISNLAVINNISHTTKRSVDICDVLKPTVIGEGELIISKYKDGSTRFTLRVTGLFLGNFQPGSEANNLHGLEFNRMSSVQVIDQGEKGETLIVPCQPLQSTEYSNGTRMDFKMATVFGETPVVVKVNYIQPPTKDILEDSLTNTVNKAILRCLSLSSLETDIGDIKDVLNDKMVELVHLLGDGIENKFVQLCKEPEPLQHTDRINGLLEEILSVLHTKPTWMPDIQDYLPAVTATATTATSIALASISTFQNESNTVAAAVVAAVAVAATAVTAAAKHLILTKEVEEKYNIILSEMCKEIMKGLPGVENNTELTLLLQQLMSLKEEIKQRISTEIDKEVKTMGMPEYSSYCISPKAVNEHAETKIRPQLIDKEVMLRENLLVHLIEMRGRLDEESSAKVFAHLKTSMREYWECKLKQFKIIHDIRIIYSTKCFIGFVGTQNAGKSSLLNALFNKGALTGMRDHTLEPTRYMVAKNISAIDYPGCDSIQDHKDRFRDCGYMNNISIFIIPYNGTPSESLVESVKTAYTMEMVAGKSAKTIFCINKAAMYNENFIKYKQEFVNKIRQDIEEKEFTKDEVSWKKWAKEKGAKLSGTSDIYQEIIDKNKALKEYTLKAISEEDFIFTDWVNPVPARGIMGPEEVRRRIKEYLAKNNFRTEDNMDFI